MKVELVDANDVDAVWPIFAERVVRCLQKTPSSTSAGDYWARCRSGLSFLIVVHDGQDLLALTVWRFDGPHFVTDLMVGERAREWMSPLVEKASEIARHGGATSLAATGRVGFGALFRRVLPSARVVRQTYEVLL